MFASMQGPHVEQEALIVYGIVTFLILAPMIVLTGAIIGYIQGCALSQREKEKMASPAKPDIVPSTLHKNETYVDSLEYNKWEAVPQ